MSENDFQYSGQKGENMTTETELKRGVCPYCHIDAMTGPWAHAKREDCIAAMRGMHLLYQQRVSQFVLNRLEEVTNKIGGVTGYKLNLNAEETEKLCRELES